ncbi:MAG: hypothetical protein QOF63_1360 [Thermoanaerobaculia bacterium]|nr:hypothetical protein [Thermoanaerobaculia bacterium]
MAAKRKAAVTRESRSATVVKKILKLAADRVPGLKAPHAKTSRRIRGHRTVPKTFIRSIISAVDAVEELRSVSKFDTAGAEEALQFEAAFRPVVDQVATLLASLTYTIDMRLAGAAEGALRTYAIGKGLARDGQNRLLVARLRRLKTDLGRKGPRKKKTAAR